MVEQVTINPTEVRGYGNVCEEHTLDDFIVSSSGLAKEKENVHGALTTTYKLLYSVYGLMFDFDKGNKQLYLQTNEANTLSLGFDTANKQLYLVDEDDTGLWLGFDEDTNELYITDAPPIVHNYTLALDSDSYTTTGSLSVSATLLDDGVAVSGATVSFTGGVSTVTATTNSSGVATATVNFTSSGTLTASYNNVSDSATVTVQTGWFDPCTSSDKLSGYGSYINLRDTTSQSITLEYDSTENTYVLYGANNSGKQSLIPCSYLDGATNFKFEAEVMTKGNNGYYQFGIGVTSTDSKTTSYNYRLRGDSKIQRWNVTNGSESESTKVSETTQNKWWKLSMVKDGTTLTTTITDVANDTVKATDTQTITSRNNQRVGLILLAYGTNYKGYFRNIKAELL